MKRAMIHRPKGFENNAKSCFFFRVVLMAMVPLKLGKSVFSIEVHFSCGSV